MLRNLSHIKSPTGWDVLENTAESFEKQSVPALAFSKMRDFSCLMHSFSYTESQQGVSKCGSDNTGMFLIYLHCHLVECKINNCH